MQHIAREGGCWVVGMRDGAGRLRHPRGLAGTGRAFPDADEWINDGDAVVVAPGGKIVAGPMRREKGILYAEIDREAARRAPRARRRRPLCAPDVFQLHVRRSALPPVVDV